MFVQPITLLPLNTQAAVRPPDLPTRTRPVDPVQPVQRRGGGEQGGEQGASETRNEPDTLEISAAGREAQRLQQAGRQAGRLSEAEHQVVAQLKSRDREVRAHEQAHLAAAGPYATSGPQFEYAIGPDGKRYAIGGHVEIDISPVPGDAEATLRKATIVRSAALAAASPSSADQRVAAMASRMAAEARATLQAENAQQPEDGGEIVEAEAKPLGDGQRPRGAGYDVWGETGTLFNALA